MAEKNSNTMTIIALISTVLLVIALGVLFSETKAKKANWDLYKQSEDRIEQLNKTSEIYKKKAEQYEEQAKKALDSLKDAKDYIKTINAKYNEKYKNIADSDFNGQLQFFSEWLKAVRLPEADSLGRR